MQYNNMTKVDDKPDHPQLKDDLWLATAEVRKDILLSVSSEFVILYGASLISEGHL